MAMKRKLRTVCLALLAGGASMVTTATCDSRTGLFEFFRDDDFEVYHDDFYYEDEFYFHGGYVEDCFFGCF